MNENIKVFCLSLFAGNFDGSKLDPTTAAATAAAESPAAASTATAAKLAATAGAFCWALGFFAVRQFAVKKKSQPN